MLHCCKIVNENTFGISNAACVCFSSSHIPLSAVFLTLFFLSLSLFGSLLLSLSFLLFPFGPLFLLTCPDFSFFSLSLTHAHALPCSLSLSLLHAHTFHLPLFLAHAFLPLSRFFLSLSIFLLPPFSFFFSCLFHTFRLFPFFFFFFFLFLFSSFQLINKIKMLPRCFNSVSFSLP